MRFNKYPGRITKMEARKRWDEGKSFIMVPCKCSAYYPYRGNGDCYYGLGQMAYTIDPVMAASHFEHFDDLCNHFEYYNCNPVVGRYAAFYVPREELE